jgi:GT2 family glycosyltransferase
MLESTVEFPLFMVSILIVNWNTCELLCACLTSIEEHCASLEFEVIVVDNASNDGSAGMVRASFPDVLLIESGSNSGFAAGNNYAYAQARGDYIWLLNSDTELLEGACEALLQFLEQHPRCGAVASALMDARDGTIQRSCRTFPAPAALWTEATGLARMFPRSRRFGFYRMGDWSMRQARRVEQPMASSLMLRRAAIESITSPDETAQGTVDFDRTLFDERFPIFFNDVDLCWRLWQKGWEIWFCPDSRVRHWGGASTGQARPAMIAESHRALAAFYSKHWRKRYHPLYLLATLMLVRLSGAFRQKRAQRNGSKHRGTR